MRGFRDVLRKDWDRLGTYSCFAGFGIASLLSPLRSQETIPRLIGIVFNLQLAVAGLLLLASLFLSKPILTRSGYAAYSLGMLMVAALTGLVSQSVVSILVLGFAFQGLVSIRVVKRDEVLARELGAVLREHEDGGH